MPLKIVFFFLFVENNCEICKIHHLGDVLLVYSMKTLYINLKVEKDLLVPLIFVDHVHNQCILQE